MERVTLENAINRSRKLAERHRWNSENTKLETSDENANEVYKNTCIQYANQEEQYAEWLEELKELRSYKEKMEMQYLDDIENPLEPLKLSAALESEIFKYNYRKENKPKEINMLDYTVMYALKHCLDEKLEEVKQMERLTLDDAIKYTKEVARKNRINKEKNTIIIPNSFISSNDCADKYGQVAKWLKELKSYKEAEEQGLPVRLPCKVGDTVYRVNAGAKQPIIPMTVLEIHFLCYKNERAVRFDAIGKEDMGEICYRLEDIGRIVFLTREEAEKKLEELKNEI